MFNIFQDFTEFLGVFFRSTKISRKTVVLIMVNRLRINDCSFYNKHAEGELSELFELLRSKYLLLFIETISSDIQKTFLYFVVNCFH